MSETSSFMIWMYELHGVARDGIDETSGQDRVAAIQSAPEQTGVEFTNGDSPGVRLRKTAS